MLLKYIAECERRSIVGIWNPFSRSVGSLELQNGLWISPSSRNYVEDFIATIALHSDIHSKVSARGRVEVDINSGLVVSGDGSRDTLESERPNLVTIGGHVGSDGSTSLGYG